MKTDNKFNKIAQINIIANFLPAVSINLFIKYEKIYSIIYVVINQYSTQKIGKHIL